MLVNKVNAERLATSSPSRTPPSILHMHRKATVPQRELHTDAPSFALALGQVIPCPDGGGRVAAFEILKSTLRTREYVQKRESEGKTLFDAMRDGVQDGMQCFDDEIEKMIRAKIRDIPTGPCYTTTVGNLRLHLSDLMEPQGASPDLEPASSVADEKGESSRTPWIRKLFGKASWLSAGFAGRGCADRSY